LRHPLGTPLDVQLADLDRFAKDVVPAFRDTRTAAAAQYTLGSAAADVPVCAVRLTVTAGRQAS